MDNKPFAEVIESSLDSFIAQCWQWNNFPTFGSLIQVPGKHLTILGCVTAVKTGSMDPMRYPFPYQKTEEELLAEQPQIFEFLKTTFVVHVLGYSQETQIVYRLPANPSQIHAFVSEVTPSLMATFFSKPDFLYPLFSSATHIPLFDDVLLAILGQLAQHKKLTSSFLDSFCQTFSLVTGNDYRRMKMFLQRIENL